MPRGKRKEEVEGEGINRYLRRQNGGSEEQQGMSESEEISLIALKGFLRVNL